MTTNEQKAAVVLCNETGLSSPYRALAVKNLSAAGLIVTDLHERALEACEAHAATYQTYVLPPNAKDDSALGAAVRVARESLAAKKPKERWTVHPGTFSWWIHENGASTGESFPDEAEPEARAYVARKNAEERAK